MYNPIIGAETWFFSFTLSAILILYAIIFYPIVKRSFILKTKNRYNSALVIVLLIILAIFISLPFCDGGTFENPKFYLFMPMNYYAVVVAGGVLLVFVFFALFKKKTIDEDSYNRQLMQGIDVNKEISILSSQNFTTRQEMKRKLIHLLAILYIATWMLEPLVFYGVGFLYDGIANTPTKENLYNSRLLFEDKDVEIILLNGLVVQFFMLICIFIGNFYAEIMRLRFKEYAFPLKRTLQTTRRPTEIYDTSASILLLLGLAISSIILTYGKADRIAGVYAQMGVICIAVFSDMFAALIGRKWGKHKWKFVKGKSVEGTIAGFVAGFFTAIIFVGWILALIGSLIFMFTDLVLDKVKISDNALNPILISIAYKLLIFLVSPMIVLLPIIKIW
ncbi:MAG: hypothetical protein ACTSVV_16995 [Promethearchaeota archaeon]